MNELSNAAATVYQAFVSDAFLMVFFVGFVVAVRFTVNKYSR